MSDDQFSGSLGLFDVIRKNLDLEYEGYLRGLRPELSDQEIKDAVMARWLTDVGPSEGAETPTLTPPEGP